MKFKDWMKNEITLDLNKAPAPSSGAVSPNQAASVTKSQAQMTMAKSGTSLVKDMASASSPAKAGEIAVAAAQKTMGKPVSTPTNPLAVGAQVYKQATGQDLKTMRKS